MQCCLEMTELTRNRKMLAEAEGLFSKTFLRGRLSAGGYVVTEIGMQVPFTAPFTLN